MFIPFLSDFCLGLLVFFFTSLLTWKLLVPVFYWVGVKANHLINFGDPVTTYAGFTAYGASFIFFFLPSLAFLALVVASVGQDLRYKVKDFVRNKFHN